MSWRLVAVSLSITAAAAWPVAAQPDLSGQWALNEELSEDFQEMMAQRARQRQVSGLEEGGTTRSARAGYRAGGRAAMIDSSGGGASRPGIGGFGAIRMLRELLQGTERLEIDHADPELTIVDVNGGSRSLYTDGRKQDSLGGEIKIKTNWKKEKLVSRATTADGMRISETFEIDDDGRLHVKTEVGGGSRPVSLTLVYDPVAAEESE